VSPRGRSTGRLLRLGLVLLTAAGCDAGKPSNPHEDSLTSGFLRIAAEPEVAPLVRASADAFTKAYPNASIEVHARSAREAMSDVFADRADLAVIGREIEPIERSSAERERIEMEAFRWARDGVAVIAHPTNPVQQVSYDDLREILSGDMSSWGEVGGTDRRIVPVLQSPNRGLSQYVARQLADVEAIAVPAITADGDSGVIEQVRRAPDALGFVAASQLRPGVKPLAVSRLKGMPYVELDAETVYRKDYPLTRSFNLVTRTPGRSLGQGFVTFATSDPGQRLVRDYGFVPATAKVTFTRRPPLAATHGAAATRPRPHEEDPRR
jgi:phosphate transport system substrate-binding protein